MFTWEWDANVHEVSMVIDLSGYGCKTCQICYLDLDKSEYDGYIVEGEIKENVSQRDREFREKVEAGYFDWN